jgi:cytochrome c-type biogenesis protein CcmE
MRFRAILCFFTPTQVATPKYRKGRGFRIGGMVENGSSTREGDGLTVHFVVTDLAKRVPVTFKGILPDLFKEGKGVVAQGQLGADGTFLRAKCWRSTMKTICRRRQRTRLPRRRQQGHRSSRTLVVNPR